MGWRRGIEPHSLLLGSGPSWLGYWLSNGEEKPPGFHCNAAPHHAPTSFLTEFFISSSINAIATTVRPTTPSIATATGITTVTLSPKPVDIECSVRGSG